MKLLLVVLGLLFSISAFTAEEDPYKKADEPFPFWIMEKGKECLDRCQEEKNSKIRSCIERIKTCPSSELGKVKCEADKAANADYYACRKRCLDMVNDIGMRDWCTRHGYPVQDCWPDEK